VTDRDDGWKELPSEVIRSRFTVLRKERERAARDDFDLVQGRVHDLGRRTKDETFQRSASIGKRTAALKKPLILSSRIYSGMGLLKDLCFHEAIVC
jgi:hypothetical protein